MTVIYIYIPTLSQKTLNFLTVVKLSVVSLQTSKKFSPSKTEIIFACFSSFCAGLLASDSDAQCKVS